MAAFQTSNDCVDVVVVRSTAENRDLFEEHRHDVLQRLSGSEEVQTIIEEGHSSIQWTKSLPSVLLYQGRGILLYDEITRDREYYLYNEEMSLMEEHCEDIVDTIVKHSCSYSGSHTSGLGEQGLAKFYQHITLVDLGSGRLDKAACLLIALAKRLNRMDDSNDRSSRSATYCAVDIQDAELRQQLSTLQESHTEWFRGRHQLAAESRGGSIAIRGLSATFAETVSVLRSNVLIEDTPILKAEQAKTHNTKCLLSLGSTITNMNPTAAIDFLRRLIMEEALQTADTMLIGVDHCADVSKIKQAYSTKSSKWSTYMQLGVKSAGSVLGEDAARRLGDCADWEYVARWDAERRRHVRFLRSTRSLTFEISLCTQGQEQQKEKKKIEIAQGEHILLNQSYKHTSSQLAEVFMTAGLKVIREWSSTCSDGSLYLLHMMR